MTERLAVRIGGLVALIMIACASGNALAQDKQGEAKPPKFDNRRYTEDYSYLRDPKNWTGAWWEPYKFIPLNDSGTRYLTLGADLRVRYDHIANRNWGESPAPTDGYGLFRVLPYADLHLGSRFRLFGQLIGAWAVDLEPEPTPADQTSFDLLQGFAEIRLPDESPVTVLRGGRQLIAYGSQRLISWRFFGKNVPLAFDGGLGRIEGGHWRADAFYMRPVENGLDDFDDRTDPTRELWSLYSTTDLPQISKSAGLDLFYIGFHDALAVYEQGKGSETRHTLGSRFFGSDRNWKWDFESHLQLGTFAGGDILAWAVASDARYTFADLPLKPYIELRANAISGDENPNDADLNSFNALFPRGKYFGELGQVGPRNLLNVHPIIGVDLGQGWSLYGASVFFWRESLEDGVYNNAGNLLRASGDSRARYIGTQSEVVLTWAAARGVDFTASYTIFNPGRFIEETGPAETIRYVTVELQLRF